jgi:hypothetical protein
MTKKTRNFLTGLIIILGICSACFSQNDPRYVYKTPEKLDCRWKIQGHPQHDHREKRRSPRLDLRGLCFDVY